MNFIIHDWDGSGGAFGQNRYFTAYDILKNNHGKVNENEAMNILSKVSQVNTRWSAVYNLANGDIRLVMNRKYNEVGRYKLKMVNE